MPFSEPMRLCLLDTDMLSEVLKRKNKNVERHAGAYLQHFQRFAISGITRYEVLRGMKATKAKRRLDDFEQFCANNDVFGLEDDVICTASDLWARRKGHKGTHLPSDADLLIAATALCRGRVLVTGNTADFDWIEELDLANWRDE